MLNHSEFKKLGSCLGMITAQFSSQTTKMDVISVDGSVTSGALIFKGVGILLNRSVQRQ